MLCFEHMLWMPCSYNTFGGRLLWFDGVEDKRGLTLTVCLFVLFVFGGGGGMGREGEGQTVSFYSEYWCLWHTMRLTSFRHYYFPRYSQWSRRQCGLTSFANCHL